jgi:hypothetical protein
LTGFYLFAAGLLFDINRTMASAGGRKAKPGSLTYSGKPARCITSPGKIPSDRNVSNLPYIKLHQIVISSAIIIHQSGHVSLLYRNYTPHQ